MPKVIVLDNLAPEGLDLLEATDGITYDVRTGLAGDELKAALNEYEGAICRSGVQITADSLAGNQRLRAIVRAGVGTDNIDKVAATRLGVVVMNTPAGNTISTAEHAFALMLGLARNTAPAHQSLRESRWDRKAYMGTQLAGKVLGIVGLGRIGQEISIRARAFDMKVVGFDPFLSTERANELGIELVADLKAMLPTIDFLTVHTPLTPETQGLIGPAELEIIKPGARLINAARGGIYDQQALVDGLASGRLGGVALDVYEQEPCTDNPLFQMPNVLCTPHLGASTEEAQTQVAVEAAQLLGNYLQSGEIRHAVNVAPIDSQTLEVLRGALDLAFRLGVLMSQWRQGSITGCRVRYRGEIATKDTRLLTSAFCAGLLQGAMDEEVNIVNAQVLFQERGIEVVEQSRTDPGAFRSSITVEVTTDEATYQAAGTLFGENMPRLVRLGEYRLESYLDGTLFIFTHDDVPGIIGTVGTIFGKHQVNIAQMAVGRAGDQPGGEAIGVLNLDALPPTPALEEVLSHPAVSSAFVITMPSRGELPTWLS